MTTTYKPVSGSRGHSKCKRVCQLELKKENQKKTSAIILSLQTNVSSVFVVFVCVCVCLFIVYVLAYQCAHICNCMLLAVWPDQLHPVAYLLRFVYLILRLFFTQQPASLFYVCVGV